MWETRIFIKMIMMIDHTDEDNKEYHIYPRDIINDFQLFTDKSAYRYIREAADSLRNRSITFPETTENGDVYEVNTSILTVTKKKIKGKPDAFIKVKFAAELKPYYKDADGKTLKPQQAEAFSKAGKVVQVIPMPRTFHLFNVADIDGIDFEFPEIKENPNSPIQQCDDFVATFHQAPEVLHDNLDEAFYSVTYDRINMPPLPRFHAPEAYYKTLFHEMTHATGSAGRLKRPGITLPQEQRRPGSAPYALEELTAELGAAYLCQIAGISSQPLEENAAAYLEGYLTHLRKDKKFLFQAASAVQKAVDFLLKEKD